ncbi:MAG: division/cell wall cluster transcriptional repressor MraZ [Nitrospirae bacterium]|nr:MAG: division/cell wall cluster transcriptional repressor MraZ [Nitrospirota bacterium]
MIPARFRAILQNYYSEKLYIANALFDKCLLLYPIEQWQRFAEKVKSLPQTKKSVRLLKRRVIASAQECELDRQGRLLIPSALRADADINGELVVVGQIEKMEIWNRKEWDAAVDISSIDRDAYEEELAELGL